MNHFYFVMMKNFLFLLTLVFLSSCQNNNKAKVNTEGEKLYRIHCSACHQPDGSGLEKLYPPLTRNKTVNGNKEDLINIILHGLSGPLTVKGEEYNQVMIPHNFLKDKDIADVLNYLRNSFENSADQVTEDEVAAVRKKTKRSF